MKKTRRTIEAIQRKNPEMIVNNGKIRGTNHENWLKTIKEQREKLATKKKRLK